MTRDKPKEPTLVGGPYLPPKVRKGDEIEDVVTGRLCKVGGYTDTPLPWPRRLKTGKQSAIVTEELAEMIRTESSKALQYYLGVSETQVWKWRKALGVGRMTPGTQEVYREVMPDKLTEERILLGRENAKSEESRGKISASKTGKPAHENTREGLLRAAKRRKSKETKERIAEANREAWKTRDKTHIRGLGAISATKKAAEKSLTLNEDGTPRLLFGPYLPPSVVAGDTLYDHARGKTMLVAGWSNAPIPWPIAASRGLRSIIVTETLVKAISQESSEAIQYHWGVTGAVISSWRRRLIIDQKTTGSTATRSEARKKGGRSRKYRDWYDREKKPLGEKKEAINVILTTSLRGDIEAVAEAEGLDFLAAVVRVLEAGVVKVGLAATVARCKVCGGRFSKSKYSRKQTCSLDCHKALIIQKRGEQKRPRYNYVVSCPICNRQHIMTAKEFNDGKAVTCSPDCRKKLRSLIASGQLKIGDKAVARKVTVPALRSNKNSKAYHLRSPDGKEYHGVGLADFIRLNEPMFENDPGAVYNGLSRLDPALKYPLKAYLGWTWAEPPKESEEK